MSSSERIESSIDSDTWDSMDENLVSRDLEEELRYFLSQKEEEEKKKNWKPIKHILTEIDCLIRLIADLYLESIQKVLGDMWIERLRNDLLYAVLQKLRKKKNEYMKIIIDYHFDRSKWLMWNEDFSDIIRDLKFINQLPKLGLEWAARGLDEDEIAEQLYLVSGTFNSSRFIEEEPYLDSDKSNSSELDLDELNSDELDLDELNSDELHSDKSNSDELHSDELDSDELDSDELDSDEFNEEPYEDYIDSYQTKTGLTEAVQTGIGRLNDIPVAIGVMDFEFIGGSMGSLVGDKITRLIEYATNQSLPLIIVCASGGARMQEGSLSLMQMAKISSALYDFQSKEKLFFVPILSSPTTGGVTASFGMLGDIIIAEPNAYIAFAGKRVIEELLKITVPEGSQETENLFEKGLFDLIVPRNLLKTVLSELLQFHGFFPLKSNSTHLEYAKFN
uniref:Acetyl-coenzyme A carboxylase carboxyl transferase subunit beta n=1 Tax=Plantago media TaxID=101992 RepID=A0A0S1EH67_9LAMI|nr:acetyl-CoA carboxylase carboxyltransferase beta subunit [Plantago media]ALJ78354.1 acetyl-CoA carboxylase carboxyltransferase beta subunit [Plantago media]